MLLSINSCEQQASSAWSFLSALQIDRKSSLFMLKRDLTASNSHLNFDVPWKPPSLFLKHLFLKFLELVVPRRSEALLTSDWLSTTLKFAKCFPTTLQDNFRDFYVSKIPLKPPWPWEKPVREPKTSLTNSQACNGIIIYQKKEKKKKSSSWARVCSQACRIPYEIQ